MSTDTKMTGIAPEILADCDAVIERIRSGKLLDPEVARRVRERAAQVTGQIGQQHGILDIGVPAIRELRDAE